MSQTKGTYLQPGWFEHIPRILIKWAAKVMDTEHFGLFRNSVDTTIPWAMQTAWHMLLTLNRLGLVERVPGYSRGACRNTVRYMQSLQDPESGVFVDPNVDNKLPFRNDPERFGMYRIHNAGRATGIMQILGGEPQYPVPSMPTNEGGSVDTEAIRRHIHGLDWSNPWGACSHAGRLIKDMFTALEAGDDTIKPTLCEAIEFVLGEQNPETGLWGKPPTPDFQQISGTLKILPTLWSYLGVVPPGMDRIADSCIRLHAERQVYEECTSACIPRNIVEVAAICLEERDYRRDELRAALASIAEFHYQNWQMPDGGFADERSGRAVQIAASIVPVSGHSESPRGDVGGFNAFIHGTGLVAGALGWDVSLIPSPGANWGKRTEVLQHEVVLRCNGGVDIRKR